jgi:periplasmic mercuric ion binding protein
MALSRGRAAVITWSRQAPCPASTSNAYRLIPRLDLYLPDEFSISRGPIDEGIRGALVRAAVLLKGTAMRRSLLSAALCLVPFATLAASPQTVTLDVKNMTCAVCPITVRKALEKVAGVARVKVDLDTKTATVTFDPDKADATALINATVKAGYPASVK